jgi:hypothetical protein
VNDVIEELARFDSDYRPAERFSSLPSTQDLAEGIYACTIQSAILARTYNSKEPILRLQIEASQSVGSMLCEHAYLLGNQQNYDRLGADLIALGFDADRWSASQGRPFSAELLKLLSSGKLNGIRFQAKRRNYTSNGKAGWSFDVCGRLKDGGRPAAPAPAPVTPRNSTPAPAARPQPVPAAASQEAEETIPF